jgi:hypothetical protein
MKSEGLLQSLKEAGMIALFSFFFFCISNITAELMLFVHVIRVTYYSAGKKVAH